MSFLNRHNGPSVRDQGDMLTSLGVASLDELITQTVPDAIRITESLYLPDAMSEPEALVHMRELGAMNQVFKSYIGQGYYGCYTPSVILRNIFENPGWYTQYTPYQAEISQGRLEALMNFQTLVAELTGLPIANASLLDEATAAAEAMALVHRSRPDSKSDAFRFAVVGEVWAQTRSVLETRARFIGITLDFCTEESLVLGADLFGILVSYPDAKGAVVDYRNLVSRVKSEDVGVVVTADLLALTVLMPPGEWGADVCVGSTQRFGVPLGYGGPHAAFISTKDQYKRAMPGRLIGLSVDQAGDRAYRMALQTREQHIRREKATSNICTAQALLAIMASMYAVYHGPDGLRDIAKRVHFLTRKLAAGLVRMGISLDNLMYVDTVSFVVPLDHATAIRDYAVGQQINFYYGSNGHIQIALDETVNAADVDLILSVIGQGVGAPVSSVEVSAYDVAFGPLSRTTDFCQQHVFNTHRSETEMLRYIKRLETKDLSLTTAMIPLGSCTMKLNATTQMIPLSWPEWSTMHPFAPLDQARGYQALITHLSEYLCKVTGFFACSLQPNSGAQGEYAGLLAIRRYHESRGEGHRDMVLIPSSAHGTNPATASLMGMSIVVVSCDENGNMNVTDLEAKATQYADRLAALMVTYPSTHGVFESAIQSICECIHRNGGLVYMDGANMNAQVGLTHPAKIGADVCHLNLHKTFAIPHGGGGPGMGPICVTAALAPFLPSHPFLQMRSDEPSFAVSAAPWGSASILIISYLYIRLLGGFGVTEATRVAILNANYILSRLEGAYPVLYKGEDGRVAHELILDLRPFKKTAKIEPEDVAKRLMDYGFHAPTMSFPVPGTLMIEPTESENLAELDRFCEAMLQIRREIAAIESGQSDLVDNVLKQAPHTAAEATATNWTHPYSREEAVYPLSYVMEAKFWPSVKRIDNAYGDRNLICTCQVELV